MQLTDLPRIDAPVAIVAADSKLLGGVDCDEELLISVRLAICPAEGERDPSGCRASGLTPELPVHVLLVPPLLRLQALVFAVERQSHRHCYFLDCPRKFHICPL